MRIGVQGLPGCFHEQAAYRFLEEKCTSSERVSAKMMYYPTFPALFEALENGEIDRAVAAIQNNTMGFVDAALHEMLRRRCALVATIELDVQQCLLVRHGVEKKDITHIVSQDPALKQCPQYIHREFPNATVVTYGDTTLAAKDVAQGILPHTAAAIAPKGCAPLYGLTLLDEGIQDLTHNYTTFFVLSRDHQ